MRKMIKLNNQNFLEKDLVIEMLESGISMNDSRYVILEKDGQFWVEERNEQVEGEFDCILPTYTMTELLYKLPEWIDGPLKFVKDAPFYCFWYDNGETEIVSEYPIRSAAKLLIRTMKEGKGYNINIEGK